MSAAEIPSHSRCLDRLLKCAVTNTVQLEVGPLSDNVLLVRNPVRVHHHDPAGLICKATPPRLGDTARRQPDRISMLPKVSYDIPAALLARLIQGDYGRRRGPLPFSAAWTGC